ncbi:SDR family NAD(P)-dependent oxidoreductase [Streptomyces sulphureus]|uniref:SDR family NAD(P)-dependent oxidoreductase n=1 Tax=Streptomyces sulphureus TaxID=47758 RepID=UPI000364E4F3|nr:SDR family oxidoreductase [Streptomyces sulphureus]
MIDTGLSTSTVLVTGADAGIGRAIAEAFAAEGAAVGVHHHATARPLPDGVKREHHMATEGAPTSVVRSLRALGARDAAALEADLAEDGAPAHLLARTAERLGPVDVLVNNAAHCESPDDPLTAGAGGLRRHHEVNVFAPASLTAELVRTRTDDRPLSVVNISTDAARAFPGQTAYGTSKAALEAYTRSAALDLGPLGVCLNAVAPGPVQTGWMPAALVAEVELAIPLRRVGTPSDIADATVFLASQQARWITGQVLQVAGGHAL